MDYSSLRNDLYKHVAYHAKFNPILEPHMSICQRAFEILDWGSMHPLLKTAIIGLIDVCAKRVPNEKEVLKIVHYSAAMANYAIILRTNTVPEKSQLEKGRSSLATLEPLIGSNSEKTGVDSLLKLYSQLESFADSTVKLVELGSSAAPMWQTFRAGQDLRESLVTLRDQISHVLMAMNDFGTESSRTSVPLRADLLDQAIGQLSSAYKGLHGNIRDTGLIEQLQPSNIPERFEMLQNSVLIAAGVSKQKKQVDPSMETIESDMKLTKLDNEPIKKQDDDWEAV
ncbi:hypothetical protein IFR05_015827 [Cadophora sp. M221]|nr:hypothetical protein IFR05_015827 [Cadophora sp. M221]